MSNKLKTESGLSEALVRRISADKKEPEWMLQKRLSALKMYEAKPMPDWGPSLSGLDMENMIYYVSPEVAEKTEWKELPKEIAETFDKLGIPAAEREYLGGAGAQYDSGVVYHKIKEELSAKGVIFENMDVAVQKYPELVQKYFMTQCVSPAEHKFVSLHAAVWSGGTFIYVPKNVKVALPLQAYFRMNREGSGQFEHTLIIADEGSSVEYIEGCSAPRYQASSLHAGCVELFVHKGARIKYLSIENWSKNTYNLNTKKALVYEDGEVSWVNGNLGSAVTMLYPASVLLGERARSDSLGIVFAGEGQVQDTGSKAIHAAPHTVSTIRSKSVSKSGGVSNYRGLVKIAKGADEARSSVVCDALILDKDSESNTYPSLKNEGYRAELSHEAKVGKIGEAEIFYLQSRGISENEAERMIITGFVEPIIRALPFEYAVELNKLIDLEISGN